MSDPVAATSVAHIVLPDRDATRRLAQRVAPLVRPCDLIGLGGALGSGKTTLVRDLIATLAGETCEVPSPTFTLVQIYEVGGLTVWHFDLYRIARPADVIELGFEDALAEGVALVEWPERLGPLLPADRLEITLEQGPEPDARVARLAAHGGWGSRLADIVNIDG